MESPEVVFIGKPPIHEHIYSNGFICLSILYDAWNATMGVASTTRSIISMLSSAKKRKKPTNDKEIVRVSKGRSPKYIDWEFEDDKC